MRLLGEGFAFFLNHKRQKERPDPADFSSTKLKHFWAVAQHVSKLHVTKLIHLLGCRPTRQQAGRLQCLNTHKKAVALLQRLL